MRLIPALLALSLIGFGTLALLPAQEPAKPQVPATPVSAPAVPEDAATVKRQTPFYPLSTCLVSGQALPKKPIDVVQGGRLFRLCCNDCKTALAADPAGMLAKLDAAVIAAQKPGFPASTQCFITKEPLQMGAPDLVEFVYDGRYLAVCCTGCVRKVKAKPELYLPKLDAAYIEQQLASYPLDTCPVSGDKLGADAKNHLYGTTLVRLCCDDCAETFDADPAAGLASLRQARAKLAPPAK